jgi:hypothetical protein
VLQGATWKSSLDPEHVTLGLAGWLNACVWQ